jgi:hypothetical protein
VPDDYCCDYFDPVTNIDHLLSMNGQEMAEFIMGIRDNDDGTKFVADKCFLNDKNAIANWLRQPYGGW